MLLKRAPAAVATVNVKKKKHKSVSAAAQIVAWSYQRKAQHCCRQQRKTRKTRTKQKPEDHPNVSSFQALVTKINYLNSFREKLPGK